MPDHSVVKNLFLMPSLTYPDATLCYSLRSFCKTHQCPSRKPE